MKKVRTEKGGSMPGTFPFIWGGSAALAIAGCGLERVLSVTVTFCCALLASTWFKRSKQGKPGNCSLGMPDMFIAGMVLYLYGHVSDQNAACAAGIMLTGTGFCAGTLKLSAKIFQKREGEEQAQASCNLKRNLQSKDMAGALVRKTEDGGYEVNIHELAAAISGKKRGGYLHSGSFHKSGNNSDAETSQTVTQTSPPIVSPTATNSTDFLPQSEPAKVILKEFVNPWIKEPSILNGIICLLKILDSSGDVPSVIFEDEQLSQGEPYNVQYESLHRVSLEKHTLHAVQEGFSVTRDRFGETGLYTVWPKIVLSIIAHDLGKIPKLRMGHAYSKLDHPAIAAEIVKEYLAGSPALAEECSEIVLYHHGEPPAGFSYVQGLEILKEADAGARKRELQKVLGHLKPWKEIPLERVAKELTAFMLDAIRGGDMARDLFYLNQKQGLLYVNPDVLIEILQTISRDTYLWPEIFAPDSRMAEKAVRDFLADRLKPTGWLTENFSREKFLWLKIYKMGKVTGPRPFVEIVFMKFVQAAEVTPSKIVEPWRKSFLRKCRVMRA